jgi:Domain of unknown function (DUF4276)
MTRLLVHVEGETEEAFVNEMLRPHLVARGYHNVGARLLGNARQRLNRGGIRSWDVVRSDISRHLKGDSGAIATTMVDYYGLPDAWPGRVKARSALLPDKPKIIENAIHGDLSSKMGSDFDSSRFIPFVVMHEFEGLLFSDCRAFARAISHNRLKTALQEIRNRFATPEEIDESPQNAPSRRVGALISNYEKPFHGTLAALEIGLDAMRNQCPHFRCWLTQLERRIAGT